MQEPDPTERTERPEVPEGEPGSDSRVGEGQEGSRPGGEADGQIPRPRQAPPPSPEEREAQGQAERFYEILAEDSEDLDSTEIDSAAFCGLMSRQARRETVRYARVSSGIAQEWDCESAVELLVIRSKRTGGEGAMPRGRIVGVNVEGDRATATVRFGRGPLSSIPLVREDGEWKLGVSPSGTGR